MDAAPFDRDFGELALDSEITGVGLQEPVKGLDDPFWFRWLQDFDLNQVIEKVPDRTPRRVKG